MDFSTLMPQQLQIVKTLDRTLAIKTGDHTELLATMKECAQALETLGCAHIAIPCNTSHYFYDQIQSFTSVPIIHMPRESVHYALAGVVMGECEFDPNLSMPAEPVRKIGIMGTDGTVGAGVYGRECEAAGVEVVYPSEKRQADVMSLIYDDVKAGREPDMDKFDRVMWEFARSGCDRVILACTELSVLQKYREMPEITLDAMDVLVRESCEAADIMAGALADNLPACARAVCVRGVTSFTHGAYGLAAVSVDLIAGDFDAVVRYSGGNNAGHRKA